MTRTAKAELLQALRREAYGDPVKEIMPPSRRFTMPVDRLDPLAAKCLANERERRSEQMSANARRQRRRKHDR